MYDLFLEWGNDLAVASGGDLALSTGSDVTSQRVCRRLLTNPGDYIWNLDYGGGLGQFVGTASRPADIEAVIRVQLAAETAVPTSPEPQVNVRTADSANGYVVASITYADPTTMVPIQLNVSTG